MIQHAVLTESAPKNPVAKPAVLVAFEDAVGVALEWVDEPHPEYKGWHWTWTPEQAAMFFTEWKDSKLFVHPLIRQLAETSVPVRSVDGQWGTSMHLLYEKSCSKEVREAIDRVLDLTEERGGGRTPYPFGDVIVDLRCRVPGFHSEVFTINDHTFQGVVKVTQATAEQLRHMFGNNEDQKWTMNQPRDMNVNLGELT